MEVNNNYKVPEKLGYYINYTLKVIREEGWYTGDNWKVKRFIVAHVKDDSDFELVKYCLWQASCLSQFIGYMMGVFNTDYFI